MSKKEKLLGRFKSLPKDFTFKELKSLLEYFGYEEIQGSGSRVAFKSTETSHSIKLHKPHPSNILKHYQIKQIKDELEMKEVI